MVTCVRVEIVFEKDSKAYTNLFNLIHADKEDPAFQNCPINVLGSNSPGQSTGLVFWLAPTADDNIGVTNLTSNYQPMDEFPIGTTQVIYTAVDGAGNMANCTFSAIVMGKCFFM